MHPATLLSIPVFYVRKMTPAPATYMFRVELRVIGRNEPTTWQGWATDASDASRRAVDDGRQRWRGYSFMVNSVVQVGA